MERVAHRLGEVDDDVAARHQVVPGLGEAVAEQVAGLEPGQHPQLGPGLPVAVLGAIEPALELGGRRAAGVGLAEYAGPGALDHPAVDVRAVHLRRCRGHRAAAERGQGVGLGAVGAPRAPAADPAGLGQVGQHTRRDPVPLLGIAPELRDVDRHPVEKALELRAVVAQPAQVVGQRGCAAALGEGADPALHLRALVLAQVDSGQPADALAEVEVVVALVGEPAHEPASITIAAASSGSGSSASARPASEIARGIP